VAAIVSMANIRAASETGIVRKSNDNHNNNDRETVVDIFITAIGFFFTHIYI
jgi:hypothetical protein